MIGRLVGSIQILVRMIDCTMADSILYWKYRMVDPAECAVGCLIAMLFIVILIMVLAVGAML